MGTAGAYKPMLSSNDDNASVFGLRLGDEALIDAPATDRSTEPSFLGSNRPQRNIDGL